jgi:hypothetical protein
MGNVVLGNKGYGSILYYWNNNLHFWNFKIIETIMKNERDSQGRIKKINDFKELEVRDGLGLLRGHAAHSVCNECEKDMPTYDKRFSDQLIEGLKNKKEG